MPLAIAIRHVAFEDLGLWESLLAEHGFELVYRDAGVDDLNQVRRRDPELLIVLGGPIGANQDGTYPFLRDELALLGQRILAERPTLGICLGAQLLARALGASVYPGPGPEIAWSPVEVTEAGSRSCLSALSHQPVLHWHTDTFDLPSGAVGLAQTAGYPNQAFAWQQHVLALQFHLEVDSARFERWLIGHAAQLSHTPSASVEGLRGGAERWGPALEGPARQALLAWLKQAGLLAS